MFLGLCAVIIVALAPLTGGKLQRLADIRLRWLPLALGALVLQVVVISVWPQMPHALAVGGHLTSYVMLGAVVWVNRQIPGMLVIAAGAGANALAITLNDGTLPASASALRKTGITLHPGFQNSGVLKAPHLAWLGDTMVSPSWLPLRNMVSIGDIVILVGAAWLVLVVTHRPAADSTAAAAEPAAQVAAVADPQPEPDRIEDLVAAVAPARGFSHAADPWGNNGIMGTCLPAWN
jgi:hypothetical protein